MQQCMFVLENDSQFKTHDSVLCLGFIESGIRIRADSHQPGAVRRGVKSYAPLGDTFSMFLTTLYTAAYIRYTILCVRGFFLWKR